MNKRRALEVGLVLANQTREVKLIPFADSLDWFSKIRAMVIQKIELGLLSRIFRTSSKKGAFVEVSFFNRSTFSSVYTCQSSPLIRFTRGGLHKRTQLALMQLLANSSTMPCNRVQRAVAHCGALTLVGSVRTRERYIKLDAVVAADSVAMWIHQTMTLTCMPRGLASYL